MIVEDIFTFKTGNLPALELTEEGDIPLVYGTTRNNGIVKFVTVDSKKQIFEPPLITVSYLGTAFVQVVPFTTSVVDKSNIIILCPKNKMTIEEMYYYAIQINHHAQFGFHYGRRMNMERLKKLKLQDYEYSNYKIDFKSFLPKITKKKKIVHNNTYKLFKIEDISIDISRGHYHSRSNLEPGKIPFVSCSTMNNGIVDYCNTDKIHSRCITMTSDGSHPSTSFYHPYIFSAQDNVIVIEPKKYRFGTILFILMQLNQCTWRFSYGRKCYLNKLDKVEIDLPVRNGKIDENYIENMVKNYYGWHIISNNWNTSLD